VVFDFETTSRDRESCEVWQIGAMAIRPRDLQIVDTKFNVEMKVLRPDAADPESLAISHTTIDEVMARGIDPSVGWQKFADWVSQFSLRGKPDLFSAPVAAGHNIVNFDLPIYERYCHTYKTLKHDKFLRREIPGIFNPLRHYDTMQMMGMLSENLKKPQSISLVNLRKFMGVGQESIDKAHDALEDVQFTTELLVKLLRAMRTFASRLEIENCFAVASQR
jgi:DNA polymerase III epsilon subunit-like protein